jgi:hypothetical protein
MCKKITLIAVCIFGAVVYASILSTLLIASLGTIEGPIGPVGPVLRS